jgi:hypothetical protein
MIQASYAIVPDFFNGLLGRRRFLGAKRKRAAQQSPLPRSKMTQVRHDQCFKILVVSRRHHRKFSVDMINLGSNDISKGWAWRILPHSNTARF